jgi:hypothetical protein
MTAGDLALVLTTVLCVFGFIGLALVLMRMLQAMRELQAAVDDLRAKTEPLLEELRDSVEEARDDLDRFDRVLGSAEAISARMDGASRMARAALSTPVIKTVALATGTGRAARRLRRQERKVVR